MNDTSALQSISSIIIAQGNLQTILFNSHKRLLHTSESQASLNASYLKQPYQGKQYQGLNSNKFSD